MENSKSPFATHVFVCTNQKKSGDCCAPRGGEELRRELKEWVSSRPEWKDRIRINASGCLHFCSEGINVVIYPQNKWFKHCTPQDASALKLEIQKMMDETSTQ